MKKSCENCKHTVKRKETCEQNKKDLDFFNCDLFCVHLTNFFRSVPVKNSWICERWEK